MKIVKNIGNNKTLFVKYFKHKYNNFNPINDEHYNLEIPKVTIANFVTNLENGIYCIPSNVNSIMLYKKEGFLFVPITGFIKFKRLKGKYKII